MLANGCGYVTAVSLLLCVCGGGWWNAVDALVWGLFVAHVSLVFLRTRSGS